MKITLPQIDFKRILKSSEGTEPKKIICRNCRNLHIKNYIAFCVDHNNFDVGIPKWWNRYNDCTRYKRSWYKFWVK